MAGILLLAVMVLVTCYVKDVIKIDENFRKLHSIPLDASMLYVEKTIKFDDQSREDESALTTIRRTLHNHMDDRYNLFNMHITSPEDVPRIDDIEYNYNGKAIHFPTIVKEPKYSESINQDGQIISKKKEFKIPLHVEPDQICDFAVSYRTKAYISAINGETDFFSFSVNRYTERLVIRVLLEGKMKEKYTISFPYETEADGKPLIFQIYDAAEERMKTSEKSLEKIKEHPKINTFKNKITWKISNPKTGYEYRLFFILKERKHN